MDCVEVCPVDCFYEGENMLVIHPDECIDCGVCVPECPVDAIKPDTEPGLEKWLSLNAEYAKIWPNITVKKAPPRDSKEGEGKPNKLQYLSPNPGAGDRGGQRRRRMGAGPESGPTDPTGRSCGRDHGPFNWFAETATRSSRAANHMRRGIMYNDSLFNAVARSYEARNESDMSMAKYLESCRGDPMRYANAAERLLAAIGEPQMINTAKDARLGRIFLNRTMRAYPAFAGFHGMEETIGRIVVFFPHAAPGMEEREQILSRAA